MSELEQMASRLERTNDNARLAAIDALIERDAARGGFEGDQTVEATPSKRAETRDRAPAGDPEILCVLLEHLDREPVAAYRARIIRYLGKRQYAEAREKLARLARDPDAGPVVAEAAREAAERIELGQSPQRPQEEG